MTPLEITLSVIAAAALVMAARARIRRNRIDSFEESMRSLVNDQRADGARGTAVISEPRQ